ncbi:MAG: hypothetical protein ACXWTH_05345, partial [Methylosarcina sp.]
MSEHDERLNLGQADAESAVQSAPSGHTDGPRFAVGIDLGTTHCVLSYAELGNLETDEFSQQVMDIPQLT